MKRKIRTFGFIIALSYIISILYIWVKAEFTGYTYFLAGEPNRAILYTEWILGFLSILVILNEIRHMKVRETYDPLV